MDWIVWSHILNFTPQKSVPGAAVLQSLLLQSALCASPLGCWQELCFSPCSQLSADISRKEALSHLSASDVLQGYQSIEKSMMMISEFKQWKVTAIHVSVYLAPVIPLQLRTFTYFT